MATGLLGQIMERAYDRSKGPFGYTEKSPMERYADVFKITDPQSPGLKSAFEKRVAGVLEGFQVSPDGRPSLEGTQYDTMEQLQKAVIEKALYEMGRDTAKAQALATGQLPRIPDVKYTSETQLDAVNVSTAMPTSGYGLQRDSSVSALG